MTGEDGAWKAHVVFIKYGVADHHRTRKAFRTTLHPGLRITVWDVFNWLSAGMTEQEILEDYPELEHSDFLAVYEYAANVGKRVTVEAAV